MRLILASGSATRSALLKAAGVPFEVRVSTVDERAVEMPLLDAGKSPAEVSLALAEAKALDVSRHEPEALVIGADQTLDFAGARWVKPASHAAAREQLALLSGHTHQLHSAVALAEHGAVAWRHVDSASLTMHLLSAAGIDAYLAAVGEEVTASVGGYQVEKLGIRLFEKIDGDHFTILGLPLLPLLARLQTLGALRW